MHRVCAVAALLAVIVSGEVSIPGVVATYESEKMRSFGSLVTNDGFVYLSSVGTEDQQLITLDPSGVWEGGNGTLKVIANTTYTTLYNMCPTKFTSDDNEMHAVNSADLTLNVTDSKKPTPQNKSEGGYMAICFFNSTGEEYVMRTGYDMGEKKFYVFVAMKQAPGESLANLTVNSININTRTICSNDKVYFNNYIIDVSNPRKPSISFQLPVSIVDDLILNGDLLHAVIEYDYYHYCLLTYNATQETPSLLSNYTLPVTKKELTTTHIVGDAWLSLKGSTLFSLLPGWGVLSTDVSDALKPVPSMSLFSVNSALPFGFSVEVHNGIAYGLLVSDKLYVVALSNV